MHKLDILAAKVPGRCESAGGVRQHSGKTPTRHISVAVGELHPHLWGGADYASEGLFLNLMTGSLRLMPARIPTGFYPLNRTQR